MGSIGITLLLWGIGVLIAAIIILVFALKFLVAARKTKEEMDEAAKKADVRLMKQYNRIATLEVEQLHTFLTRMFSSCLEIVSDREISTKDPDSEITLYTLAVQELLLYLGEETIAAIDYYYGHNYIMRWTDNRYKILAKRGIISNMVNNKSIRAETVVKEFEK